MTQPTRDELIERLAAAHAETEAVIMGLIVLELDETLSGLSAAEDQAATALREAIETLAEPFAQLAAVDGKIAAAEGKCSDLRCKLARLEDADDDDRAPDKRATARMQLAEWEAEVTRLRSKRDYAESGFQPLYEQRDNARKWLVTVQGGKRVILGAMLDPFGSSLAQGTGAYEAFRAPMLGPVLLRHDVDSPEWDQAVEQLREWCKRSGYRTDDLPSEGEQMARAMTSMMPDGSAAMADAGPSAADVMAQMTVDAANKSMVPDYIEDRRGAHLAPAPPARSYMDPGPGIRDLMGG